DLMPRDTHVLVLDPERARSRAQDLVATSEEFLAASWAAAAGGGQAPIDLQAASYRTLGEVREHSLAGGLSWWSLSPFGLDDEASTLAPQVGDGAETRTVAVERTESYRGDVAQAIRDVREWAASGKAVVVVREGHGSAERTVEVLGENEQPARLVDDLSDEAPADGVVTVVVGRLREGVVAPGYAVITEEDLTGQAASTRDMRKMPARRKKQIDPLELRPGDYVVHEQHGVGRFVEMKQRELQGAVREYLVLEYGSSKRGAPPDRLFVPADSLDQVTRYVGGESPSLDRLGGSDWTKRKAK